MASDLGKIFGWCSGFFPSWDCSSAGSSHCLIFCKVNCARTGWRLTLALVPTPVAFLLLVSSGSKTALKEATTLIGLSSGFVLSVAASVTSELFGQKRAGINHNIVITNIPLGSFL